MRIAQVAPLYESVPPAHYGGTERVVAYLTEELVREGHDVTLFASGDSRTSARLVPACRRALRTDPACGDPVAHHTVALDQVRQRADEFDIIHFHTGFQHLAIGRALAVPRVTTLHGRLDLPDVPPVLRHFSDEPLISISHEQRRPCPLANWVGTVHHGLPPDLLHYVPRPDLERPYLAFIGRMSPEKGAHAAIEIARRAGLPLKIAAKHDPAVDADRDYFEQCVRPLLGGDGVEFVGEVDDRGKQQIVGNALALLFPIDWPEPFGLIMIEALACGTPVIARPRGSVPEIIADGRSGFLFETVDEAVRAIGGIESIDRGRCRIEFERRFLSSRMAGDYMRIYERMLRAARHTGRPAA